MSEKGKLRAQVNEEVAKWNRELRAVHQLNICAYTVAVKKYVLGTLDGRSQASVHSAVENYHTVGCKIE